MILRPDISEELVKQATQPYVMTPEAFAARMRADSESYTRIIKAANIKFDQ